MYKCRECGATFEEPVCETVCFEEIYGVGSMFMDRHYGTFTNCPECGMPIDVEEDAFGEDSQDDDDDRIAYYEKEGDEIVYYDSNECEIYREPA